MYLEKAILINRAPFQHLELDFKKNGINILSAVNGKGKTTILSYIVDAFHEMSRNVFTNSYEGIENKYYRISSGIYNLNQSKPSFVYLRFIENENKYDYIDIVGQCCQEQYDTIIKIDDKIPFAEFKTSLESDDIIKHCSSLFKDSQKRSAFENNILTYFPAYRYEQPGYLNNPYKINLKFKVNSNFRNKLPNPIEVISDLNDCTNWFMDIILDNQLYGQSVPRHRVIVAFINYIISLTFTSKYPNIRIGLGERNTGGARISLVNNNTGIAIFPSIFNLSSGELSLICIFCEILRQADTIDKFTNVSGIVLIDEVDKHLHIKLQKTILPKLFALFPNIQFIISSHSPFLNMGLAEELPERSQIIDLDNNGITCSPTSNDLYKEVYEMMISENDRFAKKYNELAELLTTGTKPLIVTEGKTDSKHLKKAQDILGITDIDIEYFDVPEGWGSSQLKTLLENLSKVKQARKIIGLFDRDEPDYLKYLNSETTKYKKYGNSNVYAFAIPPINEAIYGDKISIEHCYNRDNLLRKDSNGRRLFLGDEFFESGNSKDGNYQTKISKIQHKVLVNGIIDEKVYRNIDLEQKNSIALTKDSFASLVVNNINFISGFDFSNFNQIFNIIRAIIHLPMD